MKSPTPLEDRIKARLRERKNSPEYYVGKFKVDFAESVARLLKETDISRVEIAEKLGTSRAYVTKMLNEVLLAGHNLTMETMAKLAFALGAKIDPQFVRLSQDFTESKFAYTWSSPSFSKLSERLRRFPSKPAEDYDSEPVIKVIYVQEPFDQKSEKEVGSEAFSPTG